MQLTNGGFTFRTGPDHSYCRQVVFAIVTLSLIIFSIYGNSFDCSWHFDDEPNITQNPNLHLEEITWKNIRLAICSDPGRPDFPYRPVACVSFAVNHYLGGLEVFGYHLVNIFIHLLSSIFLFLFIYHTLNLPSLKTKYASHSYPIALLATILWAVNPVQTQAITYIVQRMASLAGMFYILCMYLYLRARTAETVGTSKNVKKVLLFLPCFLSFIMALGSKENAAMLPLSIFLYEILLIQPNPSVFLRKNRKWLLISSAVILLLGITYFFLRGGNIFSFMDGYEVRPFTWSQRLLTEPRIVLLYISLLLYPVPNRLNIAHSIPISTSLFNPISTILSIVIIAGAIAYTVYLARRRPLLSFCILFFFLNHVIESTILPLELIFEHRNYIPSMLFFVPLVIGFFHVFNYYAVKKPMQYILLFFIFGYLVGLGHSAFIRNFAWKDEKTLWIDSMGKSPDLFRPYHNLGRYYDDHGFQNEALLLYEAALEKSLCNRKNDLAVTHYNLGRIYADREDYETALQFYDKAEKLDPKYAPTFNNISTVMDLKGQHELAYQYLVKAIKLEPNSAEINYNLGIHSLREGNFDTAIFHLNKSANRELKDKASFYLGIAYKQKGQLGRAVIYFKKVLKENPRNISPHLHLAEIFYRVGDYQQAERETEHAINMMQDKNTFNKILRDLQDRDQQSKIHPSGAILMPLMRDACLKKSESLKEWKELLEEKSLQVKEE